MRASVQFSLFALTCRFSHFFMVIEAGAERVAARVLPIGARGAGLNPIASASTTAHAMSVRVRHGGRDCVAECDDGWGEIIEWGRTPSGHRPLRRRIVSGAWRHGEERRAGRRVCPGDARHAAGWWGCGGAYASPLRLCNAAF